MEDFYYAGGLPGAARPAGEGSRGAAPGPDARSRAARSARNIADDRHERGRHPHARTARWPPRAGLAVLRGNLAPRRRGHQAHRGRTAAASSTPAPRSVFDSYRELQERINDPALDITADSVLVLRNAGPEGGPGMPEYGMLPIPEYLLAQGVRDMVRISDARMSGTSYGACVLHVAPESFVGGPLALVQTGDPITLDVPSRLLRLSRTFWRFQESPSIYGQTGLLRGSSSVSLPRPLYRQTSVRP